MAEEEADDVFNAMFGDASVNVAPKEKKEKSKKKDKEEKEVGDFLAMLPPFICDMIVTFTLILVCVCNLQKPKKVSSLKKLKGLFSKKKGTVSFLSFSLTLC